MKQRRFVEVCPRRLPNLPTCSCPLAVKSMEKWRTTGVNESDPEVCPWAVADSMCHHCFWLLYDREEVIEDVKKLAQKLGLTHKQVSEAFDSAIKKLIEHKDDEAIQDLLSEIVSKSEIDESIYLDIDTSETRQELQQLKQELEYEKKKRPGRVKGHSGIGAVHKDGKKIQIYGLSRNWSKNAAKFAAEGTGIKLARYELQSDEKPDAEKKPKTERKRRAKKES